MSIVPLLVNLSRGFDSDYHRDFDAFDRFLDDDFGFGINPIDIFHTRPVGHTPYFPVRRMHSPYWLNRRHRQRDRSDSTPGNSAMMPVVGKDGFQVCMDVSQFKPNELVVKTVDNAVIVEGKHEEREDSHGFIQRHFVRKYILPKDYDPKEVISTISSDGVLTVKAPPPNKAVGSNERMVHIQQTGPAHLNLKMPDQAKAVKQTHSNGGVVTE